MKWLRKLLDQIDEEVLLEEYNTEKKLKRIANLHRKNKRFDNQNKKEGLN